MSRKILAVLAALVIACSFAGCATETQGENIDYGYFEGYYSQIAYEVRTDAGVLTEQMYFLCTDPEFADPVGKKNVYFDENGELNKYVVMIGPFKTELLITYAKGDNDSSVYSEIYYDENECMTNGKWDNYYKDPDGVVVRELGEQEFYSDGVTTKSFRLERYLDGELSETTVREYDEEGNMTSETIE